MTWTQDDWEDIAKKAYKETMKEIHEEVRKGRPAIITDEGIL